MPAATVNRIEVPREPNDCAVVALAIYLGRSYEDVLRTVTVTDWAQGRKGLLVREIRSVAEALGTPLVLRRKFDLDEDYGLLLLPKHVVVLRRGLVIEPDPGVVTVWEVEDYLQHYQVRPTGLLEEDK